MNPIDPNKLWFNTPDTNTLCRAGGNGPYHPSQMYAINKYVKEGMSFLDYGSGSGTTCEALTSSEWLSATDAEQDKLYYKGVDIIPKNVEWCNMEFPLQSFEHNPSLHKIDQPDNSFDVVYSRHVVDHMRSFEEALDEHCRVAKKLVIIVLWVPLAMTDEHQIKNIVDNGQTYENEYTNSYSRYLVLNALNKKEQQGWKLEEITDDVGSHIKGHDTVIVLSKNGSYS